MNQLRRVGFIGLGNMGGAMAAHVVKAGFDLTVYDVNPEASEKFVARHGGNVAANLAAVGRGADAVITMLPDDKIVNAVMLGEHGVASTLARGSVVIDMSTCDPVATQTLAAALQPRGIALVDAPVMGGVVFARDATLDIMAAGDAAAIERITPLLRSMGRGVIACGAVGNAHALKALGNYINACAMINVVEAMTIGKKFGLDAKFMAIWFDRNTVSAPLNSLTPDSVHQQTPIPDQTVAPDAAPVPAPRKIRWRDGQSRNSADPAHAPDEKFVPRLRR